MILEKEKYGQTCYSILVQDPIYDNTYTYIYPACFEAELLVRYSESLEEVADQITYMLLYTKYQKIECKGQSCIKGSLRMYSQTKKMIFHINVVMKQNHKSFTILNYGIEW